MNYIEYTFTVCPSVPGLEIAEAALSELPFESFTIEDGVLKAYSEKTATIECNGEEKQIPVRDAVYIRLKFVF